MPDYYYDRKRRQVKGAVSSHILQFIKGELDHLLGQFLWQPLIQHDDAQLDGYCQARLQTWRTGRARCDCAALTVRIGTPVYGRAYIIPPDVLMFTKKIQCECPFA